MPDPPIVGPKADVFSLALTLRDALDPTPRDYVAAGAVDAFVSFRARHSPRPPWRRDLRDLHSSFERWLHHVPDQRPSAEEFRTQLRVLTRPAELRQRRASLLRWLLPSALALLTLFATVVYLLSKEATLSNLEAQAARARATQASQRAESMHASLEAEEAMRRQLEAEVATLDEKYQSSRLTREQLAARLASVEGEAKLLGERQERQLSKLRRENAQLAQAQDLYRTTLELTESLRQRRDDLARELDRTKVSLDEERETRQELEAKLKMLELQLASSQRVIDLTRAQIGQLVQLAAPGHEAPTSNPSAP
jgi:chromosome segregation ATPase